jgi:hypothetical protein
MHNPYVKTAKMHNPYAKTAKMHNPYAKTNKRLCNPYAKKTITKMAKQEDETTNNSQWREGE